MFKLLPKVSPFVWLVDLKGLTVDLPKRTKESLIFRLILLVGARLALDGFKEGLQGLLRIYIATGWRIFIATGLSD